MLTLLLTGLSIKKPTMSPIAHSTVTTNENLSTDSNNFFSADDLCN